MRKKHAAKALKIAAINSIMLAAMLELSSRYYFKNAYKNDPYFSTEIQEYLAFVHHSRSSTANSIKRHDNALEPKKKEKNDHMISSTLVDCDHDKECTTVVIQGDSWAHGLELNASDILFSNLDDGKHRVISGGTSSFSVSNAAGQLNYFINHKNIAPNSVILFIDQTDLGDELCRYKPYTSEDAERGKPFLIVKQEPPFKTVRYNYEAKLALSKAEMLQPRLPIFLAHTWHHFSKSIYARWIRAKFGWLIKSNPSQMLGIYTAFFHPECFDLESQILSIQEKSRHEAIDLFKMALNAYLDTAEIANVESAYIFTHPHMRHLEGKGFPLKIDIQSIVAEIVRQRERTEDFHVYHHNITPPKTALSISADYFDLNDWFSHPTANGYRIIGKDMRDFIDKKDGF